MARSSRLFLLGIIFACGVQVLLDWNGTLYEINVLRSTVQQKGENYVGILAKASDDELGARDVPGLERLSHGIFDDADTAYVRFTDAHGTVVWDKLNPAFDEELAARGGRAAFDAEFVPLMTRDTASALKDPAELKRRVANSHYKDFAQAWTDAVEKLTARFEKPVRPEPNRGVVVYQDRLRDQTHHKDDRITYAIGTVLGEDGRDIGTVLVAFDMTRTNDAVRAKYLKFAGLCTFFVCLIVVQNLVGRRNKLWLLDLQTRYAAAKKALHDAMPDDDARAGEVVVCGAVDQARGPVDGMVWSAADEGGSLLLLVVDPDGDGVDAAAVGLHVTRAFQTRARGKERAALVDEMRALGAAAREIPLTRPLDALLLRVDGTTGAYEVLAGSLAQLRMIGGGAPTNVVLSPVSGGEIEGVIGPLSAASGVLARGCSLVGVCASAAKIDLRSFADGVARYAARTHEPGKTVSVHDAVIWARGRGPSLIQSDIAVVAASRASA
jgi:hypothetical protein